MTTNKTSDTENSECKEDNKAIDHETAVDNGNMVMTTNDTGYIENKYISSI